MEEQYDIRFNRAEPSSQQIAAHQDFDALLAAFESEDEQDNGAVVVPMATRGRNFRWLYAAAAAVAFLIFSYPIFKNSLFSPAPNQEEFFATRPFVDPPATANVPDLVAEVIVDPEQAQNVALEDGQLVLSSSALFRDRGKSIGKPVQVHYRQLDEIADYFLSGLPLSYDENGQKEQLDAAVVLDVYATAAGEPVKIAEGESVAVELNTTINNDGSDYRLYQLDTVTRRWIDAGPLSGSNIAQAEEWPADLPAVQAYRQAEADFNRQIAAAEQARPSNNLPQRPTPPQREIGNNPTLELDFLKQVALASGSNVSAGDLEDINDDGIWELLPETGNVDLRAFNVEWESVRLISMPSGKYELTLINPQRQERLIVRPILLDDGNFQEAQRRFEAELAAYETAVAEASQSTTSEVDDIRSARDEQLQVLEAEIMASIEAMPIEEQQRLSNRRANFRFAISSWGIYAVAKKIRDLPSLTSVELSSDKTIEDDDNARVYLTDGKHKTLYRGLVRKQSTQLPIRAGDDNSSARVWLVNDQGQLIRTQAETKEDKIKLRTGASEPLPSSATLLRQRLVLE
ncbi:hypothetical protein CEQ90_04005 [Lewinellaceae bacterium SD302]|nr:hypothetical protein CEQ90_04005 [Lewinellaceae bacterium SD302]